MALKERLEAKLKKNGKCLEFDGARTKFGYGKISVGFGTWALAHRVAYELHHGIKLPKDKVVMHTCDNPPCCNPDHLKLGTYADNNKDKAQKGRASKTQGTASGTAVLDDKQVLAIRQKYSEGGHTQRGLAKEYGVSKSLIGSIIRRESWRHI